jgi:hypothetical protein
MPGCPPKGGPWHRPPLVGRAGGPGSRGSGGPAVFLVRYIHGPKPYKFIGFGNIHGPKPYKFIWFGNIHGSKPCKFIGFGNIHGSKPYKTHVLKTQVPDIIHARLPPKGGPGIDPPWLARLGGLVAGGVADQPFF